VIGEAASSISSLRTSLAEEHLKDILCIAMSSTTSALDLLNIFTTIIALLLLGVVQDRESFSNVLESFFGLLTHLFVSVMPVRVPLESHLLVCLFDAHLICGLFDLQDLVVILPLRLLQFQFRSLELLTSIELPLVVHAPRDLIVTDGSLPLFFHHVNVTTLDISFDIGLVQLDR
jgi:hypothetical protein